MLPRQGELHVGCLNLVGPTVLVGGLQQAFSRLEGLLSSLEFRRDRPLKAIRACADVKASCNQEGQHQCRRNCNRSGDTASSAHRRNLQPWIRAASSVNIGISQSGRPRSIKRCQTPTSSLECKPHQGKSSKLRRGRDRDQTQAPAGFSFGLVRTPATMIFIVRQAIRASSL